MYLLENTLESQEMRDKVIRLLSNDTTEDFELALQLISGGGYCFDFVRSCGNVTRHLVSLGYLSKDLHISVERYISCSNNVRMFLISYQKTWHSLFCPYSVTFSTDVSYLETSGWITELCQLILKNKAKAVEVYITLDYSFGGRMAKKPFWNFLKNSKELSDLSYIISRNVRVGKNPLVIWFSRRQASKKLISKKQSYLFA